MSRAKTYPVGMGSARDGLPFDQPSLMQSAEIAGDGASIFPQVGRSPVNGDSFGIRRERQPHQFPPSWPDRAAILEQPFAKLHATPPPPAPEDISMAIYILWHTLPNQSKTPGLLKPNSLRLTPTEVRVAELLLCGQPNSAIATALNCTPQTIRELTYSMGRKFELKHHGPYVLRVSERRGRRLGFTRNKRNHTDLCQPEHWPGGNSDTGNLRCLPGEQPPDL